MKNINFTVCICLFAGILTSCNNNPNSISTVFNKDCPKTSGKLNSSNVQTIDINDKTFQTSGQIKVNNDIGYKFTGEKGQLLSTSLTSKDKICLIIYTPDLKPLSTSEKLPQSGEYILQIFVPEGNKNFELNISLENLTLSQTKAVEILQKWLTNKPKVFASPFDTSIANELTTGPYNHRITNPEGSIYWLKKYNYSWRFNKSEIQEVLSFSSNESQATLKVKVYEERTLARNDTGEIRQDISGKFTEIFTYTFAKDNKIWKIHSHKSN